MPRVGLRSEGKVLKMIAEARTKIKALLAREKVVLSEELGELLRWRILTWSRIPPLMRKLMLPFLTLKETLSLDTAVSERGEEDERDHLVKAYKGLRSAGFDEWVFQSANNFEGLRWARKRRIDLRHLKLEYMGETDRDKVLLELVREKNEDLATYYAVRSDAKDVKDGSTLRETLELGYLTVVQCILERGTETVNKSDANGTTPLHKASLKGHLEVVKILLAAKAEMNESNKYGRTPLSMASGYGHLEVVKTLLAAKAEVDKSDANGNTPLYIASLGGHLEVVKTLLAAKAEMNESNKNGYTPLHATSLGGHLEVMKTLLAAKAEVNKSADGSVTPLLMASQEGHLEVVKTLLAAKAEVNKSNNIGQTPLYMASEGGHLEVVKTLLAAKAEVNKSNIYGRTPLYMASGYGHREVADLLGQAGGR